MSWRPLSVLHLIDPATAGGGPCTLRLLADLVNTLGDVEQYGLIVGSAADFSLARRCGLEPAGWLCPPKALPFSGWRDLRRYILAMEAAGGKFDVIHAWTTRCAALATLAAPRTPRLATLHAGPGPGFSSRYQARVLARKPVPLLVATTSIARQCRAMGFNGEHISLFPTAIAPNGAHITPRPQVRSRWARDLGVTDDTFVIGLTREPIAWADARGAAISVARVALSGRKVRLLLHRQSVRRIEAESFLERLSMRDLVMLDDGLAEPWRIVNGLDAVLGPSAATESAWGGRSPESSILPLLWALAAGVPLIAERNGPLRHVIDHDASGFLIDSRDVNAASDRIVRLYDDAELGQSMGRAAQAIVAEMYDVDSYTMRLKHAYELLLTKRSVRTGAASQSRQLAAHR